MALDSLVIIKDKVAIKETMVGEITAKENKVIVIRDIISIMVDIKEDNQILAVMVEFKAVMVEFRAVIVEFKAAIAIIINLAWRFELWHILDLIALPCSFNFNILLNKFLKIYLFVLICFKK